MTVIGLVIGGALAAGGSVVGGVLESNANKAAANTIAQGQANSIAAINKLETPFVDNSKNLWPTLQSLLTPGPSQNPAFQSLPGAQFASNMADYGISAGAGRTGISGSTAVAGGTLKTALAGQQFQTLTNPLLDLYRTGAVTAGNAGNQIANITTGASQNLAGLQVGQGNIGAGVAGGVGSSLGNLAMLYGLSGGMYGRGANAADMGYGNGVGTGGYNYIDQMGQRAA